MDFRRVISGVALWLGLLYSPMVFAEEPKRNYPVDVIEMDNMGFVHNRQSLSCVLEASSDRSIKRCLDSTGREVFEVLDSDRDGKGDVVACVTYDGEGEPLGTNVDLDADGRYDVAYSGKASLDFVLDEVAKRKEKEGAKTSGEPVAKGETDAEPSAPVVNIKEAPEAPVAEPEPSEAPEAPVAEPKKPKGPRVDLKAGLTRPFEVATFGYGCFKGFDTNGDGKIDKINCSRDNDDRVDAVLFASTGRFDSVSLMYAGKPVGSVDLTYATPYNKGRISALGYVPMDFEGSYLDTELDRLSRSVSKDITVGSSVAFTMVEETPDVRTSAGTAKPEAPVASPEPARPQPRVAPRTPVVLPEPAEAPEAPVASPEPARPQPRVASSPEGLGNVYAMLRFNTCEGNDTQRTCRDGNVYTIYTDSDRNGFADLIVEETRARDGFVSRRRVDEDGDGKMDVDRRFRRRRLSRVSPEERLVEISPREAEARGYAPGFEEEVKPVYDKHGNLVANETIRVRHSLSERLGRYDWGGEFRHAYYEDTGTEDFNNYAVAINAGSGDFTLGFFGELGDAEKRPVTGGLKVHYKGDDMTIIDVEGGYTQDNPLAEDDATADVRFDWVLGRKDIRLNLGVNGSYGLDQEDFNLNGYVGGGSSFSDNLLVDAGFDYGYNGFLLSEWFGWYGQLGFKQGDLSLRLRGDIGLRKGVEAGLDYRVSENFCVGVEGSVYHYPDDREVEDVQGYVGFSQ